MAMGLLTLKAIAIADSLDSCVAKFVDNLTILAARVRTELKFLLISTDLKLDCTRFHVAASPSYKGVIFSNKHGRPFPTLFTISYQRTRGGRTCITCALVITIQV